MSKPSLLPTLGLALVLGGAVHFFHLKAEAALAPVLAKEEQEADFVPSPIASKMLSLGFDQVMADFYWLAFVQYVGDGPARQKDDYKQAERYIDLIVTLDPQFVQSYYFASFIIGGERKQPQVAQDIIEHGMRLNQNDWFLPFLAGTNQYLYLHNETAAAKYYRMAAKFPNAPKWLGRQAMILEAKIPSLIKQVNTWDSIYQSASDPVVKDHAKVRLTRLWFVVYNTAPTREIKKRAVNQLKMLGITDLKL